MCVWVYIYIYIANWKSSRCFPTDGPPRIECMYFQMVTRLCGSIISNLQIQWILFHRRADNSVFNGRVVAFRDKESVLRGILLHYSINRNLQLKHTEFSLKFAAIMLCCKQHAGIGLDASKMMILILRLKDALRTEKVWRWRIRGISRASWTCRIIRNWSHSSFETFEIIRND